MTTLRRLYIFGAGGHGREVAWLAREAHPQAELGFVVDEGFAGAAEVQGIPVCTPDAVVAGPGTAFVTAVGDPALRRAASGRLASLGLPAATIVHPRAEVAPTARIGAGSVVCAGAVISDGVELGAHVIVNLGCTLSHDVRVGDFATLAPGVHLAGNVSVGPGAFIGIGAVVINGERDAPLTIGEGATVAAGATVIRAVAAGAVVAGVPARPLGAGSRP